MPDSEGRSIDDGRQAAPARMTGGFVPPYRWVMQGLGIDRLDAAGTVAVDARFLIFFIQEFARLLPFDEAEYARLYPDIAEALRRGDLSAGDVHFALHGFREGRLPGAVPFDAAYYLAENPDLAGLAAREGAAGLFRHYASAGRLAGRAGHPSVVPAMRRWVEAAAIGGGALAARTLQGACIHPFLPPVVAPGPAGFRGGLVLGDSPPDQLLRHRRAHRPVDSFPAIATPLTDLPGEFLYGGPAYGHFGHVMAEMIHRILPGRAEFGRQRLLFADVAADRPPGGWADLAPAMQAALHVLDVAPEEVVVLRRPCRVQTLHVVQQGSELPNGPSAAYLRLLSAFTPARLDALHDGSEAASRLYVSRSRIVEGGLILGEAYLETLLRAEGWRIFHPQEHALADQMQAYYRAETVIFAAGSAVHGTELFGANGLRHCVLLPRGHGPNSLFETVLRPRARRTDALTGAALVGSAVFNPGGANARIMGVGLLNLPALAAELRALNLAELPGLSAAQYRVQALADLRAHIDLHRARARQAGHRIWHLLPEDQIAALVARCEALLG